jgi:hypothetical protein
MKSSVLTLLVAPISMVLSGCSLFATKEPDNTIVTQSNRPIQVRHTGIESIRTTPSAILKTTTDEQYVLQVSKPEYRARMETRTRTTPAIKPTPTKVEAVTPNPKPQTPNPKPQTPQTAESILIELKSDWGEL